MTLDRKPPALITDEDLDRLVSDRILEGREIEYKLKPPSSDAEKREFLKDVTALANTVGGHIVFGLREEKGIPIAIEGFPREDADDTVNRLRQVIQDGVRPRIQDLLMDPVDLTSSLEDLVAIVLRIPPSPKRPHMVLKEDHRFYARDANGTYRLDVDELRDLFVRAGGIGLLEALELELRRNAKRSPRVMYFGIPLEHSILDQSVGYLANLPQAVREAIERAIEVTAEFNALVVSSPNGSDVNRVSAKLGELAKDNEPVFVDAATSIRGYLDGQVDSQQEPSE